MPITKPWAVGIRCRLSAIALSACWVVLGCGSDAPVLVPVTGKVTFAGMPLTGGSLILHPDASNAFTADSPTSQLQLDGSVAFKTFPFGDGVPLGKYRVTLAPDLAKRIDRPLYAQPDTTPWTLEVTAAGLTEHAFAIE